MLAVPSEPPSLKTSPPPSKLDASNLSSERLANQTWDLADGLSVTDTDISDGTSTTTQVNTPILLQTKKFFNYVAGV